MVSESFLPAVIYVHNIQLLWGVTGNTVVYLHHHIRIIFEKTCFTELFVVDTPQSEIQLGSGEGYEEQGNEN